MDEFMQSLTAMLKRHEGLELAMYPDSVGVPTIGYGHNLLEPITMGAAAQILDDDIFRAIVELDKHKPFWRMLPRNARLVVVNMCYNLGWPRYRSFKKFWAAVEKGHFHLAAAEMRESLWFTQVGHRGVELANLMQNIVDVEEV